MSGRRAPPRLIHIRAARKRPSLPPSASGPASAPSPMSSEDTSGRAVPFDVVRRDLQSNVLARDTEVFYPGLDDWTPASEVPELWLAPTTPAASDDDGAASDDAPASVDGAPRSARAPKKRAFGGFAILGALLGVLGLLGAGLYAIYFVYFRYVPVAVQHLPNKCMVSVRVDLVDWAFFKPLAKQVVPAVEDALRPKPTAPPPGPPGPSLKDRLRANAGLNVDRDLREVAMCLYQDTTVKAGVESPDPLFGFRFVVALGGRIKPGSIPGIFEAIRSEGWAAPLKLEGSGEAALIRVPGKIGGVIGQAEDGTLIFAPNDATLAKAREPRTQDEALASSGLLQQGSLEIAGDRVAFALASTALSPSRLLDQDTIDALGHVQTGRFAIDLGGDPKVKLTLEAKREGDARAAESNARRLLGVVHKELAAGSRDHAGEQAALSGGLVKREELRVDVQLVFRYPDVERGAGELAAMLRDEASPLRFSLDVAAGRKARPAPAPSTSASGSASAAPSGSASAPPKGSATAIEDDEKGLRE